MSDLKHEGQIAIKNWSLSIIPGEYWTHYKGGVYQILTLAVQESSGEPLVIYKSLKYGTVWARPISVWNESVSVNGSDVPRFKKGSP